MKDNTMSDANIPHANLIVTTANRRIWDEAARLFDKLGQNVDESGRLTDQGKKKLSEAIRLMSADWNDPNKRFVHTVGKHPSFGDTPYDYRSVQTLGNQTLEELLKELDALDRNTLESRATALLNTLHSLAPKEGERAHYDIRIPIVQMQRSFERILGNQINIPGVSNPREGASRG